MRRKLFCTLLAVMAAFFLLDLMNVPLRADQTIGLKNSKHLYTVRITGVRLNDEENFRLEARIITVDGRDVLMRDKVILSWYGKMDEPWSIFNETIEFSGTLEDGKGRRNPYCFDYSKYLRSRGISAAGTLDSFRILPEELTFIEKYEKCLFEKRWKFGESLGNEAKGIIMGVLFGDTAWLDDDMYEDFRNNGTAHVLAVSGLHVGILYGLYKKIAGKRNSPSALILLAALLFSYGVLSMWSPSVVRATLMITMSVIARVMDLRYDMLTAMSTVGLILIAINPYVIFGAGFQMSFLAITSIAFIRPVIPDKIPDFMATVLAVNLGLLPYQIYQFNYISLISVAANIPVVFLAGYLVPTAIAAFLVFCVTGGYGMLRPVTEGMAMLLVKVNELSTLKGYGALEVVRPPLWCVLLAGGTVFFISSETFTLMRLRREFKKITVCFSAILIMVLICQLLIFTPLTKDDIVFVDVGQGDCIHIRDGRMDVLIDGGGNMNYNVGKNTLKPYLMRNGASDLDLALVTHQHMDHYKGIQELDQVFKIKNIVTSMTAGKIINVSDNVQIETLWPETIDHETGQDANNQCSVFMVYYKEYRILITGDLDQAGEKEMLEKYAGTVKLKADILKIGHHGSAGSTSQAFLDAIEPIYAVIQVGENYYGHPTAEVLEKCQNSGIIVLRNDYNGAVGFSFRKGRIDCHFMIE